MRYYFNIRDGDTLLDDEGLELDDMDAVKSEAVNSAADSLKDLENPDFWKGEAWTLWVTDQPNGGGNTLLTLSLSARLTA